MSTVQCDAALKMCAEHGCVYATTTTPGLLFHIPAQCKQS